jgi:hypothetical protein
MKKFFTLFALVAGLIVLAVPFAGVAAQDHTVVITEDQINSSYRVTNPWRRSVTNLSVDLQDGQAVITATLTTRVGSGRQAQTTTYQTSSVWTPSISNGRIYWTLVSATANGEPASQELINQINLSISSSWRNYVRAQTEGRVTGITVTENDMTITWA